MRIIKVASRLELISNRSIDRVRVKVVGQSQDLDPIQPIVVVVAVGR